MLGKFLAMLLGSLSLAFGQPAGITDSSKVVIVSSRVGAVINRDARDHFQLFGQIPDFRRAIVLQRDDSTFAVLFSVGREGELERDTSVMYSLVTIKMIAEKVDHYEALMAGTYRMGQEPVTLHYATGSAIEYKEPHLVKEPHPVIVQKPQAQSRWFVGAIPLAADPGYPRMRRYPTFDLGIGIRSFGPDLSGMSGVFLSLPSVTNPLLTFSFEVAISEVFALLADGAHTASEPEVGEGLIGAIYYVQPFEDHDVRPYISAGIAICSIEIRSGPYADAGATGFFGNVGLEFRAFPVALDVYAGYHGFPTVSTTWIDPYAAGTPVGASLNLSSFVFGLRLKILS